MSATKTLLILAATPLSVPQMRVDAEVRQIMETVKRASQKIRFVVAHQPASRPRDVQRALLEHQPHVVHFCGHGWAESGLILEDDTGAPTPVPAAVLADLFALFAHQIECVVLNACRTEALAAAIAQYIPSVIGMSRSVTDHVAIEFSASFYDALAAGQPVEFAYRFGRSAIKLAGLVDSDVPVLKQRERDVDSPTHEPAPGPVSESTANRHPDQHPDQHPELQFFLAEKISARRLFTRGFTPRVRYRRKNLYRTGEFLTGYFLANQPGHLCVLHHDAVRGSVMRVFPSDGQPALVNHPRTAPQVESNDLHLVVEGRASSPLGVKAFTALWAPDPASLAPLLDMPANHNFDTTDTIAVTAMRALNGRMTSTRIHSLTYEYSVE